MSFLPRGCTPQRKPLTDDETCKGPAAGQPKPRAEVAGRPRTLSGQTSCIRSLVLLYQTPPHLVAWNNATNRNQFSYSSGGQKSKGRAGPVPPEGSWPFPGLLQLLQPPECLGLGALPALLTFLTLRTPGLRQTHLDNPGSLAHLSSLNLLTDATSLPPCAVSWPQDLGRGCGHLLGPWFRRHTWLRPQSPSYLGGQRWPAC